MGGVKVRDLDADAISYRLGPRLNAAGRMESAEIALELLMAREKVKAAELAHKLECLNSRRKKEQETAIREIAERGVDEEPVLVVEGPWHEGVIGIIAGRLTEEYRRPTFVMTEVSGAGALGAATAEGSEAATAEILKGSGRSFGEFNLAEALKACEGAIIGGGGHAEACGLKVAMGGLSEFRRAVNDYYRSLNLRDQERFLTVREDVVAEDLEGLTLELLAEIKQLEPFGEGNEEPVFLLPEMFVLEAARLGDEGQHLRMVVRDGQGRSLKLMKFYAEEELLKLKSGAMVNVWVRLRENVYRGTRSLEGEIVKASWA